jgi:SAM-dependent methyltransferase
LAEGNVNEPRAAQRPTDYADQLRQEYARREGDLAGQDLHTLFNNGQLYLIQQRQRAMLALLRRAGFYPLTNKRILEVGCGSGGVLRELLWVGAQPEHLHGVDLLGWRLREAKAATPHLPLVKADGRHLPYANASFDLVAHFTVFSSVLDDDVRRELAAEMLRVVRPNGLLLWYDFWLNPMNPQTRGVRPSEIRALFPNCRYTFRRITLAPPVARLLAPYSWLSCFMLESLRIFNTHYLVIIQPQQ